MMFCQKGINSCIMGCHGAQTVAKRTEDFLQVRLMTKQTGTTFISFFRLIKYAVSV